jgi:hypothetical protein
MNTFTTVNISSLRSFTDPYMSALSSGVQSAGQTASRAASQGYAIAHTTLKAMGENIGTGFTSLKTTVVNNASSLVANTTQALETAAAFGARTIQQIPTAFNQASQTAALTFKAMGDRSTRIGQNTVIARNIVVVCAIVSLIAYGIFRWISYTNTLKAQLATAQARVATLEGQLTTTTAERDAAQTQRDGLQRQLTTATARVATLEGQLAAAEARISELEITTATTQATLASAEERLITSQAAHEAALAALRAQLTTAQEAQPHASDETASGLVSSFIPTSAQQPRTVTSDPSDAPAGMPDETDSSALVPASFVAVLPSAPSPRSVANLSAIADRSVHSLTSLGGTPKRGGFDMTRPHFSLLASPAIADRQSKALEAHLKRTTPASATSGPHTLLRSPTAALSPKAQKRLIKIYQRARTVDGSPAASSESGITQAAQRALRSPSAPVTPKSARFKEEQSGLIRDIASERKERTARPFATGTA